MLLRALRMRILYASGAALALMAAPGAVNAQQAGDQKSEPPKQQQQQPAQQKPAPQQKPQAGDQKAEPKKVDEFVEAAQALEGPAGSPECVWTGRRVVNLLWRDDLDTAFRHLDLYDRFGCPSEHVQITFRCVVRQGNIDPKAPESLGARIHQCWLNPSLQQPVAASPAASSGPTTGTQTQ